MNDVRALKYVTISWLFKVVVLSESPDLLLAFGFFLVSRLSPLARKAEL